MTVTREFLKTTRCG